jgi:hypothetical protein
MYTWKISFSVSVWIMSSSNPLIVNLICICSNVVSSTTYDKVLRNKIGQAIVERIKKAHAKGEKFKIFILIPLIPAFEGDLASSDASAAR